jgi:hypothetical protein
MIKAEELRIGNWVEITKPRHGETFIKVESIANDIINLEFREYSFFELKPILLTEEILLKCGFEDETDNQPFDLGVRTYDNGTISIDSNFEVGLGRNSHFVKYLHQLQNLYYALTGEELKVDL